MRSGNDPATPQPTLDVFGQALIDFAGNGERWNAAYFRRFLVRAAKPLADHDTPNGAKNGTRHEPVNVRAELETWAAEERAKEAAQTAKEPANG